MANSVEHGGRRLVQALALACLLVAAAGCADDVEPPRGDAAPLDGGWIRDYVDDFPALDAGSMDMKPSITETVTCTFNGSTTQESCQSVAGSCTGVGSCTVAIGAFYPHSIEWSSSCGGKVSTTADGTDESAQFDCVTASPLSETVTCHFAGSAVQQTCSSVKGSCQGTTICSVVIQGKSGGELLWGASPCGAGGQKTTIDGEDDHVQFWSCGSAEATETVTCVFKNSSTAQTCINGTGGISSKDSSCTGVGSCSLTLTGLVGQRLGWKHTCNGPYTFTILDGKDESAEFECGAP